MLKKLDRFSPNVEGLLGARVYSGQSSLNSRPHAVNEVGLRYDHLRGRGSHPPERLQTSGLQCKAFALVQLFVTSASGDLFNNG